MKKLINKVRSPFIILYLVTHIHTHIFIANKEEQMLCANDIGFNLITNKQRGTCVMHNDILNITSWEYIIKRNMWLC